MARISEYPASTPQDSDQLIVARSGQNFRILWTAIKTALQTFFDTLYAPISKGVTNGDAHDHIGGDGGTLTVPIPLATHCNLATVPASSIAYTAPAYFGTSVPAVGALQTVAGTIRNLYIRIGSAQPASGSLVCTVQVNGADTSIVATIPAGSGVGNYSDTTNSVAITPGQRISFKLTNNANPDASAQIGSVVIELDVANK